MSYGAEIIARNKAKAQQRLGGLYSYCSCRSRPYSYVSYHKVLSTLATIVASVDRA